jgi:hypothetical protein
MSRGWFLKSCRDYSTKFNGRLRTVRVNFVRTHDVRRIKAYDQRSRRFFFLESCVRHSSRKPAEKILLPRGPGHATHESGHATRDFCHARRDFYNAHLDHM